MANPTADNPHPPRTACGQTRHTEEILHRTLRAFRVVMAQLCSTIDRFAFFAYGVAAGLVLAEQFLPSDSQVAAALASLGTFLVGFLSLPIVGRLITDARSRNNDAYDPARVARLLARVGHLVRRVPAELVAGTLAATAAPAVSLMLYVHLIPHGQQVLHVQITLAMLVLSAISAVAILVAIRVSAW
ncbi:hypothetical protein [Pseudonocardia alaniniphila]|uniref:Uncharacterized protein n=2 Tax=Pseudonocardia alaniniphila TaxID=75291 RepID=A0ABS9TN92_9PSEU|nr:hypothetical protein [Pseudonocardia alaniniphila]